MVSSHYYQLMYTAKKLQHYHKERCHLQEDTSSQPQSKKSKDEYSVEQSSDMWTLKQADCKKFNGINNQVQDQRGTLSPQLTLT